MDTTRIPTRRRRRQKLSRDVIIDRIRDILLQLGGEAHRREVIICLAKEHGLDVRNIPEDLESAVIQSFDEVWRDETRREAYGFWLRFGEGSHRWGVKTPELAH